MAESKDLVRFVYYVFAPDDLFLNLSDLGPYKIDECIQEYQRLCQEELQITYPEAEIAIDEGNATEIYVESLDNAFEQTPDSDEQAVIEIICKRIFDSQSWVVLQRYMSILRAKDHTKIPLPVIRWLCKQKLIEGANNSTGRWEIMLDDIPKMHDLILFVDSQVQMKLLSDQIIAITGYLEDLSDISMVDIPENVKFFVASRDGFDEILFRADNAL